MDTLIVITGKYLILAVGAIAVIATLLAGRTARNNIVKLALLSFPVALLIAFIAGLLFYDSRPFVVEHVEPLIPHAPDNGFPSDHTLFAIVTAAIMFTYSRKLGVLLGIMGVLVGISRVAAKVHYPIDIAGSIAIAIVATSIAWIIIRKVCSKEKIR